MSQRKSWPGQRTDRGSVAGQGDGSEGQEIGQGGWHPWQFCPGNGQCVSISHSRDDGPDCQYNRAVWLGEQLQAGELSGDGDGILETEAEETKWLGHEDV